MSLYTCAMIIRCFASRFNPHLAGKTGGKKGGRESNPQIVIYT